MAMMDSPRLGALSQRGYRWYSVGNFLSMAGFWVQRIAIGWLAWEQTHSETWVGLIAFAQFAPVFALSIPFGAMADRFDHRRASVALNMLFTVWAAILAGLSIAGWLTPEWLLALSFAYGITAAAYGPVRLSIIPALVPKELRASAVAINSILFNSARLIGPAAAGLIVASVGTGVAFMVNAISYLPLLVALALVPMTAFQRQVPDHFLREIADGLRYARNHALIWQQLLLTAWAALFGRGVLEMMPVFADQNFGRGASGLAFLTAAAGAGAVLSGVFLSLKQRSVEKLADLTITLNLLAGLGLLLVAHVENFPLGLLFVALLGFGATGAAVTSQSVFQIAVDDKVRGRVSSLWMMAGLGGTAFGALLLGIFSQMTGLGAATMASGAAALILPLWFLLRVRPPKPPRKGRKRREDPVTMKIDEQVV